MRDVNVTELRKHLPTYLREVQKGEELRITSRGKVIARIVSEQDRRAHARATLRELRKTAWVGDVVSPIEVEWDAEQ